MIACAPRSSAAQVLLHQSAPLVTRGRPPPTDRRAVDRACVFSRCKRSIRSSPMNSPWEQWSPYWWQTVMAAPPPGVRFQPSAAYAQPNDTFSSQSGSAWTPAAARSDANGGILGQLAQPANQTSNYPLSKSTSLLGQFLTGVGMAQATQDRPQTETEMGVSNYVTPAQSRSDNMSYCVDRYVKCQDLHGSSMLRNGKRCGDCFNMCTLYGGWPFWYCPIY